MKAVAALCVGCGLASLLPAVVVTFDDLPPANWASDAFLSGGFLFSQTLPLVSREFALISIPGDCFPSCVDNGTQYLADFSRDNGFEITQANG